jgi:hypothetical protein
MTGLHLDEFIQLLEQPEARKIVSGALFDYVGKLAKEAGAAPQNHRRHQNSHRSIDVRHQAMGKLSGRWVIASDKAVATPGDIENRQAKRAASAASNAQAQACAEPYEARMREADTAGLMRTLAPVAPRVLKVRTLPGCANRRPPESGPLVGRWDGNGMRAAA